MASPIGGGVSGVGGGEAISEAGETGAGAGDLSMVSARSVELHRRVSVMSRLSNATRISDIFHTTNGAEDDREGEGGQTPVNLTPFRTGEMLPEMDLEFGEIIGGDGDGGMAASSDEDFGGVIDYDEGGYDNDVGGEAGGAIETETPFSPPPEEIMVDGVVDDGVDDVVDEEVNVADEVEEDTPSQHQEPEPPLSTPAEPEDLANDDPILFSDEDIPTAQTRKKPVTRRPRRKRAADDLPPSIFPRPFLKSLVASITGDNVDKSVIEELVTSSDLFFDQVADDLGAYTDHCKRKTVEPKDVVQLMRRQRLINDSSDVLPLAQRHLPAELIAELSDVFTIRAPKRRAKKKTTKETEQEEQVGEEQIEETTIDEE